jgi:hypothetical protein
MPGGAYRAVVVFEDGASIHVQSTVEEINEAIGALAGARVPVIKLLDEAEAEVWINADHIRAFHRGNVVELDRGETQTDFEARARTGRIPFGRARQDADDPAGTGGP